MSGIELKQEVKSILERLQTEGEEFFFISMNPVSNSTSQHGSVIGRDFLHHRLCLIEDFYKHCANFVSNSLKIPAETLTKYSKPTQTLDETTALDAQKLPNTLITKYSRDDKSIHHTRVSLNSLRKEPVSFEKIDDVNNEKLATTCIVNDSPSFIYNKYDNSLSQINHKNVSQTNNIDGGQNDVVKVYLIDNEGVSQSDEFICPSSQSTKSISVPSQNDEFVSQNDEFDCPSEPSSEIKISSNTGVDSNTCGVSHFATRRNSKCENVGIGDSETVENSGTNSGQGTEIEKEKVSESESSSKMGNKILPTRYSLRKRKPSILLKKSKGKGTNGIAKENNKTLKLDGQLKNESPDILSGNTSIEDGVSAGPEGSITKKPKLRTRKTNPSGKMKPNPPYYCEICKCTLVKTWYAEHMKQHERKEKGNWLVTCAVCGEGFLTVIRFKVHLSLKHGIKNVFKCGNCNIRFSTKSSFRRHYSACKNHIVDIESNEDSSRCVFCLEEFSTKDILLEHLKLHKIDSSLTCEICKAVFETVSKLRKHRIQHSLRGMEYKCTKCPKVFAKSMLLKSHLKIYHKEKHSVCKVCGALFSSTVLLDEHWKIHNPHDQNTCKWCWKSFPDPTAMKEHMSIHDAALKKLKSHECKECGKIYEEKFKLVRHMQSHVNGKPFSCDICDAPFRRKDTLRKHKRRVHSKNVFMCDICGNVYSCKEILNSHKVEVHSEKKIHKCKFCDREFRTLNGHHQHVLDNHCTQEDVHEKTTFKVHKCTYCPKMYAIKPLYSDHLNSHTGACPYVCDICDIKYSNSHDLRLHKLTHKARKFVCHVCNHGFITHGKYREHLKSNKHKNNVERADLNLSSYGDASGSDIDNRTGTITIKGLPTDSKSTGEIKNPIMKVIKIHKNKDYTEQDDQSSEVDSHSNIESKVHDVGLEENSELIFQNGSFINMEESIVFVVTSDDTGDDEYIVHEYDATSDETVAIINQEFVSK